MKNRKSAGGRTASILAGGLLAAITLFAGTANAAQPDSHTGDNQQLQIKVTGSGLYVSGWEGSSLTTLIRAQDVDVYFAEYNKDPNDASAEVIDWVTVKLGSVRSFKDVSAPAELLNQDYPNGYYLCVQSNAFTGRPCAKIEK